MKSPTMASNRALVGLKRYVSALLIMACAIAFRVLLNPILGPSQYPFITLGGGVVFCSWYCGRGPSVVATLGGMLYVWHELLPPIHSFALANIRSEGASLLLFGVVAGLIIALGDKMLRAENVARSRITAQTQADRALRESEQRFRTVTDAAPLMVWMSGTDKLCYYFNKGWLDFVGRTLEQEAGNGWTENVHPEDFNRCLQIYVRNFDAQRPFEMEYRLRHHTGQYRWIFDRGLPRYAPDGAFEGYVGGCLDIHDRTEAAEKVRVADETLRLMKTQDEERRRIARELHDTAGQTLSFLSLSFSQLMRKAQVVAPELVTQGEEIEEVMQQLHQEIRTTSYLLHPPLLEETGLFSALDWYVHGVAQRSGMALHLDLSRNFERLPPEMELAIFRIVQECLTNIHRHAESKTASIRVAREGANICIEVRDEGKGMSPERLAEIHSRGSGVGINGIRERLRQFHGDMRIESASGGGTRVLASIPLPTGTNAANQKQRLGLPSSEEARLDGN